MWGRGWVLPRRALWAVPGWALAAQQVEEPYSIAVSVDLVVLHATVRDHNGLTVTGLIERDFVVFENGVAQMIQVFRREDEPLSVGLVIDHSGSMRTKLRDVVTAARMFVAASRADDRMFVVNFNDRVTLGLPASVPFSSRPQELVRAIDYTPAEGRTRLYDAVALGLQRVQLAGREKKVLVVVSDGGDTASRQTLKAVLQLAAQTNVLIYAVGIANADDPDRNPEVLRKLAQSTGGEAFFAPELPTVVTICERIAQEIRSQYTLGYISNLRYEPGVTRTVRVAVKRGDRGKLQVRVRNSYRTPDAVAPVKGPE